MHKLSVLVSKSKSLCVFYGQPIVVFSSLSMTVEFYCRLLHGVFCILGKTICPVLLLPMCGFAQHEWFASLRRVEKYVSIQKKIV